jgi:hypothetical protein
VVHRFKASVLGLCLVVLVAGCALGNGAKSAGTGADSSGTPASSTGRDVAIESSLEGYAVLPPRIRWTATTSLSAEEVQEVRLSVDGYRVWVDFDPPYSYGEEGAYLAPRWIAEFVKSDDGVHNFKVRVVATTGERWGETVGARVPKASVDRRFFPYGIWERLSAAHSKTRLGRRPIPSFPRRGTSIYTDRSSSSGAVGNTPSPTRSSRWIASTLRLVYRSSWAHRTLGVSSRAFNSKGFSAPRTAHPPAMR